MNAYILTCDGCATTAPALYPQAETLALVKTAKYDGDGNRVPQFAMILDIRRTSDSLTTWAIIDESESGEATFCPDCIQPYTLVRVASAEPCLSRQVRASIFEHRQLLQAEIEEHACKCLDLPFEERPTGHHANCDEFDEHASAPEPFDAALEYANRYCAPRNMKIEGRSTYRVTYGGGGAHLQLDLVPTTDGAYIVHDVIDGTQADEIRRAADIAEAVVIANDLFRLCIEAGANTFDCGYETCRQRYNAAAHHDGQRRRFHQTLTDGVLTPTTEA